MEETRKKKKAGNWLCQLRFLVGALGRTDTYPRPCTTEENLAVLPLTEVVAEIFPGSLGSSDVLDGGLGIGDISTGREEGIDVGSGLLDVAFDIHSESRSFGESETEVESDGTGDSTETDEETPSEVEVASNRREGQIPSLQGKMRKERKNKAH